MRNKILIERKIAFQELIHEIRGIRIRISGNSMMPTLSNGAIVNVEDVIESGQLNEGDIVLFQRYNLLVIHRIIKIVDCFYFVKGDNEDEVDVIRFSNILGKVSLHSHVVKVPNGNYVIRTSNYTFEFLIFNQILEFIKIEKNDK